LCPECWTGLRPSVGSSFQQKLQGLDEWETIRDSQIKPSVMRALDVSDELGGFVWLGVRV